MDHQDNRLKDKVFCDVITRQFCIPLPIRTDNPTQQKYLIGTTVVQRYIPFDLSKPQITIEEKFLCKHSLFESIRTFH